MLLPKPDSTLVAIVFNYFFCGHATVLLIIVALDSFFA